jgi:hypothetical protein
VVGRVTIIMPAAALDHPPPQLACDGTLAAAWQAARQARDQAAAQARADQDAPGGCAHPAATASYRPPVLLREYVAARDLTCRFPVCGQPAWRGDLDHTLAWHRGGLTCSCNLGALCRGHHLLKQREGWILIQPWPGWFQWRTPAGITYTIGPDLQPA